MLSVESWNFTDFKRHRKAVVSEDVHNQRDRVGHSMGKHRTFPSEATERCVLDQIAY